MRYLAGLHIGLRGADSPQLKIVVHGDSITSTSHPTSDPTKNWSRLLVAAIEARTGTTYTLVQRGIGGHSWDYAWPSSGVAETLIEDAVINVDPHVSPIAKLVVFAGTNGLVLNAATPAAEAADADTYIAARLAAGWVASNIYVLTMIARESYSDAKRLQYCAELEAVCEARGCNIVRIHEDFDLGVSASQFNTAFVADQIHPTALGHQVIAEWVYDAMLAPEWTPALLASAGRATLALHLDAQDAATVCNDAGTTQAATDDLVWTWRDKSANAAHAVQATSTSRGVKKSYLGKPCVQFGGWGSGDYMQSATITSGLPASDYSIFWAAATDVSGGNHHIFESSPDNSTGDAGAALSHQGGWIFRNAGSSAADSTWAAPFAWTALGMSCGSARTGQRLINGGRGTGSPGTSSTAQAQGYRLAAPYSVTGFQLGGYLGEVVWFSGQMLNIDMQRMQAYMTSRWGGNARPDAVTFTPVTGATAGATVTSNTVTVAGLASDAAIRFSMTNRQGQVSGLEYSVNGGAWAAVNTQARLVNGDTVQLRRPASSISGQMREDEIHFGPLWLYWSVTTA